MTTEQLDLFAAASATPVAPAVLREEERFGKWDAKTGLGLRNDYSKQLSGDRLEAYERAFRAERYAIRTPGTSPRK